MTSKAKSKRRRARPFVGEVELGGTRFRVIAVPARPLSWSKLTDAERAVAELMLRGLTNAEIARALQKALRTVANQARAIFHKLGCTSRADLAALCADPRS